MLISREFEDLAIKVLNECYKNDKEKAKKLLERNLPNWGNMCALELAADAKAIRFLVRECCQRCLNCIWKGGMPRVANWQVQCFCACVRASGETYNREGKGDLDKKTK